MTTRYDRRRFLATAAAMGAVLAWPSAQARTARHAWTERRDLHPEGVASGDPAPDSVVLWTRRPDGVLMGASDTRQRGTLAVGY